MKFPDTKARWLPVVIGSAMLLALLPAEKAAAAAVLSVPQDFPTIQAAINAAAAGDTVLVAAGTYVERIDFLGKDITVESEAGPADTVIDGSQAGSVVTIRSTAGQMPVLRGFTIRNGNDTSLVSGGGIGLFNGPALVEGNWVTGNASCAEGGGITAQFGSSATIRGNVISDNRQNCSSPSDGGGIFLAGGSVQVLDNIITRNVSTADGGGIATNGGQPTISGNVISDNQSYIGGNGGGISMINQSSGLITNNVIAGNQARLGGGISWSVPSGGQGPTVANNTIVNNRPGADDIPAAGTAVYAAGFDAATRLINNILAGSTPQALIDCNSLNDPNPPVISNNDIFNAGTGPAYGGGICPDQTGVNGNISADPLLIDPATGDFHLRGASPAIDAGLNALAPATDIDGDARPLDGNGDGVPVVDMGADEFTDSTPPTITCTATPATLSPGNHKLQSVSVDISVSDDSGSATVTLVSVTSNQADSGLGRDDTPNDIVDWTTGTDDRSGLLRAERFGAARVYTLTYQASDPSGNTGLCQTTVTVPIGS